MQIETLPKTHLCVTFMVHVSLAQCLFKRMMSLYQSSPRLGILLYLSFSCPQLLLITKQKQKKRTAEWLGSSSSPLDACLLRESMPIFKSKLGQGKTMLFSTCTRPLSSPNLSSLRRVSKVRHLRYVLFLFLSCYFMWFECFWECLLVSF